MNLTIFVFSHLWLWRSSDYHFTQKSIRIKNTVTLTFPINSNTIKQYVDTMMVIGHLVFVVKHKHDVDGVHKGMMLIGAVLADNTKGKYICPYNCNYHCNYTTYY